MLLGLLLNESPQTLKNPCVQPISHTAARGLIVPVLYVIRHMKNARETRTPAHGKAPKNPQSHLPPVCLHGQQPRLALRGLLCHIRSVDILLVLCEPPQRCGCLRWGWGLLKQCGTLSFRVGKALSLCLRPQSFTVPLLPIPSGYEPMAYSLAAAYMERTQPIPCSHL